MSVHSDECLSKILLQLKFQAIILKDYWPLKGLLGSHIFLCLCSIVFIFIRENNWRGFPLVLEGINTDNYPLHSSLIKLISIIVQVKAHFEALSSSHWPTPPLPLPLPQCFLDFILSADMGRLFWLLCQPVVLGSFENMSFFLFNGLLQFVLHVWSLALFSVQWEYLGIY